MTAPNSTTPDTRGAWTDAQIEAFRKDAARYRWLRTSADISWNGWVTYQNLAAYEFERAEMDAAIDAAMQGATP